MAKFRKTAIAIVHVTVFSFSVHVWHFVRSDTMVDAATDVGLDKIADFVIHGAAKGAE
jgi:hypothetical protein